MTLVIPFLTVAAASIGVILLLARPWRHALVPLVTIGLSGLTAVGSAITFDETQVAIAWLATLVVALALRLSPDRTAASGVSTGPFRLLGRVAIADAAEPVALAWRDRVFQMVLSIVLIGGAGLLADRAIAFGTAPDFALTWAALIWFMGGLVSAVLATGAEWRTAAYHATLNGLAIGLVLVDRDWGRALAVGVVQLIVAINGVVSTEAPAP